MTLKSLGILSMDDLMVETVSFTSLENRGE
jgi:hypothetical protein